MKNLLKASLLCLMAVAALACGPDPVTEVCEVCGKENCECETPNPNPGPNPNPELPTFKVELKTVETDYVEFSVSASAELEMAYLLSTEASAPAAAVLFVTGTTAKVKDGDVIKITDGVASGTNYWLYAVAKLDDKNYSDVNALEFKTKEYEFKELITVVETYYDGYKVHITVPEEVKKNGNAIRYTATSLAVYNVNKVGYEGIENLMDAQSVVSNGDPWEFYVKNDSTIVYNNENQVKLDKDGNPVLDMNGDYIDIHNPISPGEPSIFLAGECRWGTFDEMGDVLGYYYGIAGSAYVVPLFDRNKLEWTGAFDKKIFFAKEPTLCDATVEIEIPEDEISVIDANIYFNMEPGVERYFYMVLDDMTYNQVVTVYLDGHEEWFQWFLTSYLAFYEWGIGAETESIQVNAASSFYEPLSVDNGPYHVLCTVMGDDAGGTQRFIHKQFNTKEKTKRAPVIEVKSVETGDPYLATFNIKSTSPDNPITGAYYACNYAREFQLMLNSGYTYESLLKGNYQFTPDEVAKINSPEGLTWDFPTLDGEELRLAVYGCNDEYTFNLIDKNTEGSGWADYMAPMLAPADMIDSPYYESLEGDWTATATLKVLEEKADGSTGYKTIEHKSKITLGSFIPGIPEQIESHVYDLYTNNSEEDVDGMFAELLTLADNFAEYRVIGQNRILCTGFMDYDFYAPSRMNFMSPYDLFKATDYSSYDVPQLIYDFGPKWYLEVQEDGSLIVPFSSSYLPPMHAWPGYPFYVGGVCDGNAFIDGENADYTDLPGFPVEVSDDHSTITVKPIVRDGQSYYMNAIGVNGANTELIANVVSDIVLTKGWTDTKAPESISASAPSAVKAVTMDGRPVNELPKARIYKSLTDFSKVKPLRQYKVDEKPNVVTMEMVDKTTRKILNNEIR